MTPNQYWPKVMQEGLRPGGIPSENGGMSWSQNVWFTPQLTRHVGAECIEMSVLGGYYFASGAK
eukprot:1141631-Pelagomonas_calceolata.AAC.1